MSTASPLPLQPLPPPTLSPADARALKQQVSSRLMEHRQRRLHGVDTQPALPMNGLAQGEKSRRVADSVAARFAQSVSYREFLAAEAQAAVRKAEATVEVARRTAEAVAAAQQQLLSEMEQWNAPAAPAAEVPAAPPLPVTVAELSSAAVAAEPRAAHVPQASIFGSYADVQPLIGEAESVAEVAAEPAVALPANLIEFPRQLVAARRARPRLAEGPLRDEADAAPERAQLRIFEVEANSVSTEPIAAAGLADWHIIRLDAQDTPHIAERPDTQTSLTLPVFTAPVSLRLMAVTVDACCILSAFFAAVATAAYASPELPGGLSAAVACGVTLFVFGLLYYMLFFTLTEATPGMRYARIGLCTFADDNPTRSSMRRRVFAMLLAGLPLGLGWVWACMDEDGLGWHDRISRMYPREY
ncbi:MAG: RDD family protein [Janthinobacterium lividum]